MTLQRLNPRPTENAEARGFMAPYVRVATHVGYCIAWVNDTTDEEWEAAADAEEGIATSQRVCEDLRESSNHLLNQSNVPLNAFVNQTQADRMHALQDQLESLAVNLATVRTDALMELQTLADNLAYAAAEYERHVSGNHDVSEGRNA